MKRTHGQAFKSTEAQKKKPRVGQASGLVRQAKAIGGWAPNANRPELKYKDSTATTNLSLSSAFVAPILLNGLLSGADVSERVGRKVTLRSLLFRYTVSLGATSVGGSPTRILLIYDKQANGALPAVTDVLLADNFSSPNNLAARDRFVTLADIMVDPISVQDSFSVAGSVFKLFNLEEVFSGGTATIGSIASGSLFVMMAQNGSVTTAAPSVTWYARVRYVDA